MKEAEAQRKREQEERQAAIAKKRKEDEEARKKRRAAFAKNQNATAKGSVLLDTVNQSEAVEGAKTKIMLGKTASLILAVQSIVKSAEAEIPEEPEKAEADGDKKGKGSLASKAARAVERENESKRVNMDAVN